VYCAAANNATPSEEENSSRENAVRFSCDKNAASHLWGEVAAQQNKLGGS
jgi:hypothetical protein